MSLVEVLIAMGLFAALMATLFAIVQPAGRMFSTAPDAADVQQRLRVAVGMLSNDLLMAGAGPYEGDSPGPLLQFFAPLRPGDTGTAGDSLTLMYVPSTPVQTRLAAEFTPASERIEVAADPGCPAGLDLCGITAGMTLLVFDEVGNADLLEVQSINGSYARVAGVSRAPGDPRPTYAAGCRVVEAVARRYWRKTIAMPPGDQLMRDDAPVIDAISGLTFEYFAEPLPPAIDNGRPTYGPAPPPLMEQTTAYPAGENCTFVVDPDTGAHLPRLPVLGDGAAPVALTPAQLADGPWCPDERDPNRWDADVLRIRRVVVRLRVRAPSEALHGTPVPDQEVQWEIAPRNMALRSLSR